jgi:hypothetical protein
MSEIKVNKISPKQTCTQLTLGDSGDTIIIPAGATITNNGTATGFGRTGAVNWDTTKKTTGFTAVNGVGYFCDTTGGAFTVTLPLSPSAGAIVAVADYANIFATNNLTVGRNGSNIGGVAANAILSTNGLSVTFVYVDATQGWIVTDSGNRSDLPTPQFVTATGGTITTCGNYKIHTFTGPGTFTVSSAGNAGGSNSVDYLVVAGGASGGAQSAGGGGGAGGFRYSNSTFPVSGAPGAPLASATALPVTATAYPITVGAGGAAVTSSNTNGNPGSNSIFSTITSAGGGGGGSDQSPTSGAGATPSGAPGGYSTGLTGGSGGGTRGTFATPYNSPPGNYYWNPGIGFFGASGNTPPVSPPQGNAGGMGYDSIATNSQAGGGGGAMAVGGSARGPGQGVNTGGPGGAGAGLPNAFGTSGQPSGGYYYFSGGGGGGQDPTSGPGGTGAIGGGGTGAGTPAGSVLAVAGTANTGGGGGGAGQSAGNSAAGGSGIVVIRYKYQ